MKIIVSGDNLGDAMDQTKKALDDALARTLVKQQGKFIKDNPKDTGRMASSWQIGKNKPPKADRGEGWAQPGDARVEQLEYTEPITFKGNWYLSNNVPYAARNALDYRGGQAQRDWFSAIAGQTTKVFTDQFNRLKPK
jgi:hypothetical protein